MRAYISLTFEDLIFPLRSFLFCPLPPLPTWFSCCRCTSHDLDSERSLEFYLSAYMGSWPGVHQSPHAQAQEGSDLQGGGARLQWTLARVYPSQSRDGFEVPMPCVE